MESELGNLTIGGFAKADGVKVETIRFYQRKALLPEPDRPYGSIRRYGKANGMSAFEAGERMQIASRHRFAPSDCFTIFRQAERDSRLKLYRPPCAVSGTTSSGASAIRLRHFTAIAGQHGRGGGIEHPHQPAVDRGDELRR